MTAIDVRHLAGPFDIIGDVHGCAEELELLLAKLGYAVTWSDKGGQRSCRVTGAHGRRVIFVGDFVDRGPRSPDVLRLAMRMAANELALCVPGNHDVKFLRWLNGANVKPANGLAQTIAQMEAESDEFRDEVKRFLSGLVSHLWLDGGTLAVAHAGVREDMIGLDTGEVRSFCLYGDTTGQTDEYGLPVRRNWGLRYKGSTHVVYGHTPIVEPEWVNRTLCIDTACVFGGKLTALRWPEKEIVSIPAERVYVEPTRPLGFISQMP